MSGFDFVVSSIVGRHESPEVICIDKFLGDDAIRLLSSKINGNMSKRRLVLRGNCIGPAGAEALAAVLREKSNFSFISLEWNQIGSEGTTFLSEALTFNTNLIHLDLRNNGISDEGAYCLAKALGSNDTLKTLDLRWNQVELLIFVVLVIKQQKMFEFDLRQITATTESTINIIQSNFYA
jgi:Ran GTPase-activating protein (RanGAP) involved in mRNA processing and transport